MRYQKTNKWLQDSFTIYNGRYFGNRLPGSVKVRYGKPAKDNDAHWDDVALEIVVNENLRGHDSLVLLCLLHEMAHGEMFMQGYVGSTLSKDPHHGMRFQAELDRLYRMGAYDGLI